MLPVLAPIRTDGNDSAELDSVRRLSPRQTLLQQAVSEHDYKGLSIDTSMIDSSSSKSLLGLRNEEEQEEDHPKSFICPISGQCMHDPVVLADGHTYERAAIERHLADSRRSPITNEELPHTRLMASYTIKKLIREWPEKEKRAQKGGKGTSGKGASGGKGTKGASGKGAS